MSIIKVALGVARLPFLLLAPAVLFPVWSYTVLQTGEWQWSLIGLILVVAISAHIAVNALNEYQDFNSKLDLHTQKTPFSGGSGTLPLHPDLASVAFWVFLVCLCVSVLGGLELVRRAGSELLLPGLVGVLLIISYTRWINKIPLLCLLAPGLGFGLVMVNGTGLVLSSELSAGVMALSLVVTCLCSTLLLLNQFPDIEADRKAGRRHVLIYYGIATGVSLYIGLILLAYLLLTMAVVLDFLPISALAGLLTVPLSVSIVDQLRKATAGNLQINPAFIRAMAKNVAVTLLTPVLAGAGILLTCFNSLSFS